MDNNTKPKSNRKLYILAALCALFPVAMILLSVVDLRPQTGAEQNRIASQQIREKTANSFFSKCNDGQNTSYCQCTANHLTERLTLLELGKFTELGVDGTTDEQARAFIAPYEEGCI